MGFAPIPFRRFRQLVRSYGCDVRQTSREWEVIDSAGDTVSTFSVTHGKRTKGNEVKPIYEKRFFEGLMLLQKSKENRSE